MRQKPRKPNEMIAELAGGAMVFRKHGPTAEWVNLTVWRRGSGRQRKVWCLSWNGERFARSADLQSLTERDPGLVKQVEAVAKVLL